MLLVAALDTRRSVIRDPDDLDNLSATFALNLGAHASNYTYFVGPSTSQLIFFWIDVSCCGVGT